MSRARFAVTVNTPRSALALDKKELRKTMRRAGQEVAAAAKALMRASGGGRASYKPGKGGRYGASAAGQAPAVATGQLLRSLKVRPFKSGLGVTVRASEFYALFLEAGAQGGGGRKGGRNLYNKRTRQRLQLVGRRVVAPRPFLSAALEGRRGSLDSRIKAALDRGVAFKRVK